MTAAVAVRFPHLIRSSRPRGAGCGIAELCRLKHASAAQPGVAELAGPASFRIWEEARRRPVPDAVAIAAPGASRAITTAGVALAASFAMLAVPPLEQFRQLAIIMAAGVILDAIAVRSLLVPALVALFGRPGMWPGYRREPRVRVDPLVSTG